MMRTGENISQSNSSSTLERILPVRMRRSETMSVSSVSLALSGPIIDSTRSRVSPSCRSTGKHNPFTSMCLREDSLHNNIPVSSLSTIIDEGIRPQRFHPAKLKIQDTKGKPLIPSKALELFARRLSSFEKKEMSSYNFLYYLGLKAAKIEPNTKSENNGFDKDGVYRLVKHDHIAYRYEIYDKIGEGTFSQVISAFDHRYNKQVAIKIIKNQHRFYEQSFKEIEILNGLTRAYKGSSYSVELNESFSFRGHRFLVFDLLHLSLYSHLKAQSFQGLPLKQVLQISYQLLHALSQIHGKKIIHCDLKPENIMFSRPELDRVKIIDFGAACIEKKTGFQYIQSRYYRSPEVILGYPYNQKVDMWSFGCILLELMSGKPPFRGENAHQQLLSIMEFKEYPPLPFIAHAPKRKEFFFSYERAIVKPDIKGNVKVPCSKSLNSFVNNNNLVLDLAQKCLEWEPDKRITALQALRHPVFARSAMLSTSNKKSSRTVSFDKSSRVNS